MDRNLDEEIARAQQERIKQLRNLVPLGGRAGAFGEEYLYGSADPAAEEEEGEERGTNSINSTIATRRGLVTSYDSDEENEPLQQQQKQKSAGLSQGRSSTAYTAPKHLLEDPELMQDKEDEDVFKEHRKPNVAQREDAYRSRWRKRQLSPPRVDPFATSIASSSASSSLSSGSANERTYSDIIKEAEIDKEKARLMDMLAKKKKEEESSKRQLENKPLRQDPHLPHFTAAVVDHHQQQQSSPSSPTSSSLSPPPQQHEKQQQSRDRHTSRWDKDRRDTVEEEDRSSKRRKFVVDKESGQRYEWGKPEQNEAAEKKAATNGEGQTKELPNFAPSGKLAASESNVEGVEIKWTEPPEACLPNKRWRLYTFKNDTTLGEPLLIYKSKATMFGRERRIVDIPTDHPSCSKQHAVLCFREVHAEDPDTFLVTSQIKPYLIDLKSTNGTFLNDKRIEDARYYELRNGDVFKFGNSTREYVILSEESVVK